MRAAPVIPRESELWKAFENPVQYSCLICEDQVSAGILARVFADRQGGCVPKERQPRIRPIVCSFCRWGANGTEAGVDKATGRPTRWLFVAFRRPIGRKPRQDD